MLDEVLRKGKVTLWAKECRERKIHPHSLGGLNGKGERQLLQVQVVSKASLVTVLQSEGGALQQDQIMT